MTIKKRLYTKTRDSVPIMVMAIVTVVRSYVESHSFLIYMYTENVLLNRQEIFILI